MKPNNQLLNRDHSGMFTVQKLPFRIIPFLIVSICIHLAVPQQGNAGADTALFKKGVASFQSNRYSDAIGTFTSLLKAHPGTPLKDMTIYYLARAHLKSGHRQQAADLTARLMREYPASYNRDTIDAELLKVVNDPSGSKPAAAVRPETGAVPAKAAAVTAQPRPPAARQPAVPVKVAARPAPAEKPSKIPPPLRKPDARKKLPVAEGNPASAQLPTPLAQRPRPVRVTDNTSAKISPTRPVPPAVEKSAVNNQRTMANEQYASVVGKGTAPLELDVSPDWVAVKAGSTVSIPFTLSNRDSALHKLRLSCEFPPFFLPLFQAANGEQVQEEVAVKPGATYRGILTLAMPPDAADGARFSYRIFAHPLTKQNFIAFSEVGIIASAEGEQD